MDKRLAQYRARKRREAVIDSFKSTFRRLVTWDVNLPQEQSISERIMNEEEEEAGPSDDTQKLLSADVSEICEIEEDPSETCPSYSWFTIVLYGLYTLLWTTLMGIAVHVEFGAVFLIISLLMFIWFNTRVSRRNTGELSAYSVFNPNCEAIDGTLKAEQLEKEMMYGAFH